MCPQTGMQPISQGCSATSQCQSQQSDCACQQLNTGSMGCCQQPQMQQQQPQQQITVTVTRTFVPHALNQRFRIINYLLSTHQVSFLSQHLSFMFYALALCSNVPSNEPATHLARMLSNQPVPIATAQLRLPAIEHRCHGMLPAAATTAVHAAARAPAANHSHHHP